MSDVDKLSFGDTLRFARMARGLKIDDIAEMAHRSQGYLSNVERDKVQPTAEFLESVAAYYGCPWWNPYRNRHWLQALAWMHGNVGVDRVPGDGDRAVRSAGDRAAVIVALGIEALADEPRLREEWDRVLGGLQLPGLHRLALPETQPVWAWIVASIEIARLETEKGSASARLRTVLQNVKDTLQMNVVDVDGLTLAEQIRRHRVAHGWSPENLALTVNALWGSQHGGEPLVDTALIEALEDARTPVSLDILSTLGQVFNITPSSLLTTESDAVNAATEEQLTAALRAYGLRPAAMASVRDIIRLLRSDATDE